MDDTGASDPSLCMLALRLLRTYPQLQAGQLPKPLETDWTVWLALALEIGRLGQQVRTCLCLSVVTSVCVCHCPGQDVTKLACWP